MKTPVIGLILTCSIFLVISDSLMKKWTVTGFYIWWLFAIILYAVGLTIGCQSFLTRNISVVVALVNVLNIVLIIPVGWFFFKETLSIREIIGITLAIISIVVLEWKT